MSLCTANTAQPHPVPCRGGHDSLTFLLHNGAFKVKSSLLILSCPLSYRIHDVAWHGAGEERFGSLGSGCSLVGWEYIARYREGQGCRPKGGGGRVDRSLSLLPHAVYCLLHLHEPCTVMCFRCPTVNLRGQALDSGVRGIEWWGKQRARSMSREHTSPSPSSSPSLCTTHRR